jgi:hypothetical protein
MRFAGGALFVWAAAGAQAAVAQGTGLPTKDQQVAAAVQAAPEDMRAAATVMGFDARGALVVLRQGTNDVICLADDPARDGFEVACHHESVEPYIARGRELRAQGVTGPSLNETRWKEMQEGKLAVPANGASNYILTGTYDAATGEIRDAYLRWVVYTPFATPASTGLTTRGGESAPWLMFPGTPGSHIMIVPPRRNGGG